MLIFKFIGLVNSWTQIGVHNLHVHIQFIFNSLHILFEIAPSLHNALYI